MLLSWTYCIRPGAQQNGPANSSACSFMLSWRLCVPFNWLFLKNISFKRTRSWHTNTKLLCFDSVQYGGQDGTALWGFDRRFPVTFVRRRGRNLLVQWTRLLKWRQKIERCWEHTDLKTALCTQKRVSLVVRLWAACYNNRTVFIMNKDMRYAVGLNRQIWRPCSSDLPGVRSVSLPFAGIDVLQ